MKNIVKGLLVIAMFILISCGGKSEKKESNYGGGASGENEGMEAAAPTPEATTDMADLTNKGIGPVKSVTLAAEIDKVMADKGKEIYESKCTACHKPDKKFIGPAPVGILERRSPEWVMNMILNPEEMIQKDPIAKQLLVEYNGSPMANQGLTESDARSVLEYFRTLK